MSNQIVAFNADLPAYLRDAAGSAAALNKDVALGAQFPTMSIRGKRFTVSQDGQKKILMKPGEEDEVAQSIAAVILRANMHAKVFYLKKYVEGGSDNLRPDCYSLDGVAPSAQSPAVQATKCGICPHNVWGSRISENQQDGVERKGKACADNARLAISAPDKLMPMLLRVPPGSLKPLREAVKLINQRQVPYNAVIMKIGFDMEATEPKLTFKPVGLLGDGTYAEVKDLYDGEIVRAITGVDDIGVDAGVEPEHKPAVEADELDAALAARAVSQKAAAVEPPAPVVAKAKPVPAVKPKPAPAPVVDADELDDLMTPAPKPEAAAPKPAPAPAAPPTTSGGSDSLLSELDSLLGNKDD